MYKAIPGWEHYDSCMEKTSDYVHREDEVHIDDYDDLYEDYFHDKPVNRRQLCDSKNAFVNDGDNKITFGDGGNDHEIAFVDDVHLGHLGQCLMLSHYLVPSCESYALSIFEGVLSRSYQSRCEILQGYGSTYISLVRILRLSQ